MTKDDKTPQGLRREFAIFAESHMPDPQFVRVAGPFPTLEQAQKAWTWLHKNTRETAVIRWRLVAEWEDVKWPELTTLRRRVSGLMKHRENSLMRG